MPNMTVLPTPQYDPNNSFAGGFAPLATLTQQLQKGSLINQQLQMELAHMQQSYPLTAQRAQLENQQLAQQLAETQETSTARVGAMKSKYGLETALTPTEYQTAKAKLDYLNSMAMREGGLSESVGIQNDIARDQYRAFTKPYQDLTLQAMIPGVEEAKQKAQQAGLSTKILEPVAKVAGALNSIKVGAAASALDQVNLENQHLAAQNQKFKTDAGVSQAMQAYNMMKTVSQDNPALQSVVMDQIRGLANAPENANNSPLQMMSKMVPGRYPETFQQQVDNFEMDAASGKFQDPMMKEFGKLLLLDATTKGLSLQPYPGINAEGKIEMRAGPGAKALQTGQAAFSQPDALVNYFDLAKRNNGESVQGKGTATKSSTSPSQTQPSAAQQTDEWNLDLPDLVKRNLYHVSQFPKISNRTTTGAAGLSGYENLNETLPSDYYIGQELGPQYNKINADGGYVPADEEVKGNTRQSLESSDFKYVQTALKDADNNATVKQHVVYKGLVSSIAQAQANGQDPTQAVNQFKSSAIGGTLTDQQKANVNALLVRLGYKRITW